jgi:molybdate transport system regulatory protein
MNQLTGTIAAIESSSEISIVEVDVAGDLFSAIVLETPQSTTYLRSGQPITVLFKETEVALARDLSGLISIRNLFQGRIIKITPHAILTTVTMDYKNQAITSVISTKSARRLDLKEGQNVQWLVKTNEVSLWPMT